MTTEKLREVNNAVKGLIKEVREASRQQKALWQKIPYLALQANGRGGYSEQYKRAYHHGYWAVTGGASGFDRVVFVDLETGELVDANDPGRTAWDTDIFFILNSLHLLDAAQIVKALRAAAKIPFRSSFEDTIAREERIRTILQQGDVTPTSFRRSVALKKSTKQHEFDPVLETSR